MLEITILLITFCIVVSVCVLFVASFFLCTKASCCHRRRADRRPPDGASVNTRGVAFAGGHDNVVVLGDVIGSAPTEFHWKPPSYEEVAILPTYEQAVDRPEVDGRLPSNASRSPEDGRGSRDRSPSAAASHAAGTVNAGFLDDVIRDASSSSREETGRTEPNPGIDDSSAAVTSDCDRINPSDGTATSTSTTAEPTVLP